jgi:hypothetical protein
MTAAQIANELPKRSDAAEPRNNNAYLRTTLKKMKDQGFLDNHKPHGYAVAGKFPKSPQSQD